MAEITVDCVKYRLNKSKKIAVVISRAVGIPNDVVLPEEVEGCRLLGIGRDAFCGCRNLKSIIIPNSVNSLGCYVFSGCENLEITIRVDCPAKIYDRLPNDVPIHFQ